MLGLHNCTTDPYVSCISTDSPSTIRSLRSSATCPPREHGVQGNNRVVAVNHGNHSGVRGPNRTYYRAVKGVPDTLERFASSRPTIEYRGGADSSEP